MRLVTIAVAMVLSLTLAVGAVETREIGWRDLVPAAEPLENPFTALSYDVRDDIATIVRTRADFELGYIALDDIEMTTARALEEKLATQGIDIDAIMAQADALAAEVDRRNAALVGELDGTVIRMPGYALPLEFSDTGVSEFLLVPYVGACIHVPPPPINQTVFVDLAGSFEMDDLFAPVWVTGTIRTERGSRALSFVDGSADILTGYVIEGVTVEPYR